MSDKIYYIQENGAVSQAYSIEELRIKNLSPTSLVCVKYDTWKEAKDIPEVAKIIYWTPNMPIEQNWSPIQQSQVQNNKIIVSPKEVIDPTVKIWTIILSSLLIVGFFLPWIKVFVSVSAWDVIFGDVSKAVDIGSKYFLVLLPLLGIYNIIVVSVPNDSDPTFNKIVRTLPIIILGLFIFIGLGSINDKLDLEGLEIFGHFSLGFWVSLLSSIILIFLNKYPSDSVSDDNNQESSLIQPESIQPISFTNHEHYSPNITTTPEGNFDLAEWFEDYSKFLFAGLAFIVLLLLCYYIFFRQSPEEDGKQAAISFCDCTEKYNAALLKTNEAFVSIFENEKYIKQMDARNKLDEFQNTANTSYNECNNKSQVNYNKLRNRFQNNKIKIEKFDLAYNSQQGQCNTSNAAQLRTIQSEIEEKIQTIKDPEPDIEKIKSDLIGQKIPGWNFEYLSEYKSVKILNVTRGLNRVEFQLFFHLVGSKYEHDCEVLCSYTQGNDGWIFNGVKMLYITYDNKIAAASWTEIYPIKNCTFSVPDSHKLFWDMGSYWKEEIIMTGPDVPDVTLPNRNSYKIKSREGKDIIVRFTYRPYNNVN